MNVTRRFFLKSSAALAATYCGITPMRLLAEAGLDPNNLVTVRKSKTLVAIFLRGGMDGLNFVVPFKDPGYYKARRNIALSEPGKDGGVVDLDGFFGLHPRAAALAPLFQKGQAVALQAVGYSLNTRSHFEEQDTWETGVSGNTLCSDGWLNRHLLTSQGHGPIRAVSIGDTLPRILRGKAPAFSVRGITDLGLFPDNTRRAASRAPIRPRCSPRWNTPTAATRAWPRPRRKPTPPRPASPPTPRTPVNCWPRARIRLSRA